MVCFYLIKFEQINSTFEHHNLCLKLLDYFELLIDPTILLNQKYSNSPQT